MPNQPMGCPNSIHNEESDGNAGMNIVPVPDTINRWRCFDCGHTFTYENGISKLN